jgi:hypothetical protein
LKPCCPSDTWCFWRNISSLLVALRLLDAQKSREDQEERTEPDRPLTFRSDCVDYCPTFPNPALLSGRSCPPLSTQSTIYTLPLALLTAFFLRTSSRRGRFLPALFGSAYAVTRLGCPQPFPSPYSYRSRRRLACGGRNHAFHHDRLLRTALNESASDFDRDREFRCHLTP